MSPQLDAIVVGSGPNGLSAAVALARAGHSVRVIEAASDFGGGVRTAERTLPGYLHDVCSAVHPTGALSPCFREYELEKHGLQWLPFPVSAAHPLDDGPAPLLVRSPRETGQRLGVDASRWAGLFDPFVATGEALMNDLLGPMPLWPSDPLLFARFGMRALPSASLVARTAFRGEAARALFAGCAAHSILPLERWGTGSFGMVFGLSGHLVDWPCAKGGSRAIAEALVAALREHGGEIEVGAPVRSMRDLPDSRAVLFDLSPANFLEIAGRELPPGYAHRLQRFEYGPGVFKVDWALDGPIPWTDPEVGRASTVHVGGTLEEIARSERDAWEGKATEKPFLIVCQQSVVDASRAPAGKHTGYAYCHVPAGCTVDMTARIEAQVERFAPGFRDLVLARHTTSPAELEAHNPNYVGGAITGGAATLRQVFARPVLSRDPYATPNPRLFLCSASTPPGGGVHGMCGWHAARSVMRSWGRKV